MALFDGGIRQSYQVELASSGTIHFNGNDGSINTLNCRPENFYKHVCLFVVFIVFAATFF